MAASQAKKGSSKFATSIELPDGAATTGQARPRKKSISRAKAAALTATSSRTPTKALLEAKKNLEGRIIRQLGGSTKKPPPQPSVWEGDEPRRLGADNIIAVTIGQKRVGGVKKANLCVVVHVKEKVSNLSRIHKTSRIKTHIGKIETDVIQAAPVQPHYADEVYRPAPGGCSMSSMRVGIGTATCVVSIPAQDGSGQRELCFLGSNHTFAGCGEVPADDWMLQPSPGHGGQFPQHAIARLRIREAVRLKFDSWNEVDCAIAATLPHLKDGRLFEIGNVQPPVVDPVFNTAVVKVGAGTGIRYGVIRDVDVRFFVDYRLPSGAMRRGWFQNLFQIEAAGALPFSAPGDSGALVIEVNTRRPVGMIIGGHGNFTYCCRISRVLQLLNAAIESAP